MRHHSEIPTLFARALQCHRAGQLEDAEAFYKKVLKAEPTHADAWHLSGLLLHQREHADAAVKHLRRAIDLNASAALYRYNLGVILQGEGRVDDAQLCYQQAIALDPQYADAYDNLGVIHKIQERLQDALICHEKALEIQPQHANALYHLGQVWEALGQYTPAFACYERALQLQPGFIEARRMFAGALKYLEPADYPANLRVSLMACFASSDIEWQELASVTAWCLKQSYPFNDVSQWDEKDYQSFVDLVAADELWIAFLEKLINVDVEMERLLTGLRRFLLSRYVRGESFANQCGRFIAAFAQQCHYNEYVFYVEEEEKAELSRLNADLSAASPSDPWALLVYALYSPLYGLAAMDAIHGKEWPNWLHPVLQRTYHDCQEQRALRREISVLSPVSDITSLAVQAQYEQNPYPRWLSIPRIRAEHIAVTLRTMFPNVEWPKELNGPLHVLVAGCGTGRHAINVALSYKNSHVLAVDLSLSSLAYAKQMASRLNVTNIEFAQVDLLQIGSLGRRFHLIECMGVLHHLADPLEGWKVLVNCLKPQGLMRVGLYSEIAREMVAHARRRIHASGLKADAPDDIRGFRKAYLGGEFPALQGLTQWRDFFSLSECRDLLFHHTEHSYTIEKLRSQLDQLELSFMGFACTDARIKQMYRQRYPDDRSMTNLESWSAFEPQFPDVFRDMYQFWCARNEVRNL